MSYSHDDITLVFGIRAQEYNPWVIKRLDLVGKYYNPLPKVVVVDFGSHGSYKEEVKRVCDAHGFLCHHVHDEGVFSPAIARNLGSRLVETELVFFNDIDCFWTSDFFKKLAHAAKVEQMDQYWDRMLNMPVYHLTEDSTDYIEDEDSSVDEMSVRFEIVAQKALTSWRRDVVDFVAPYSNVFLVRRDYFEYLGGYNENFRGHGSEDFEFLIRYACFSKFLPIPKLLDKDYYSPLREGYYGELKEYKGFRRLFEVISFPAEMQGLKVLHLHHAKPSVSDWVSNNDWKRSKFEVEVSKCIYQPWSLLEQDWINRGRKALVLLKHKDQYEYFLPLRLAGYSLEILLPGEKSPENVVDKINDGYYDAVSIFNPYMKSHSSIRPYFELAKNCGVQTIVIERGALPGSWYYAKEVAYGDEEYVKNIFKSAVFSKEERANAVKKINELISGEKTLESLSSYDVTYQKYSLISSLAEKVIFIPLQLHDDMAVTRFTDGYQSYCDFFEDLTSLLNIVGENVVVLIKPHPLSVTELSFDSQNVVVCDPKDNVHAILDLSQYTICYNSGVGLLSLVHGNQVFTIGNSFYSHHEGLASPCGSLSEAFEKIENCQYINTCSDVVFDFMTWLVNRKYSYFISESIVKDFGDRKSHAYKNILPCSVNINGLSFLMSPSRIDRKVFKSSYLSAKLNVYHKDVGVSEVAKNKQNSGSLSDVKEKSSTPNLKESSDLKSKKFRLKRKLANDPYMFFHDAKNPIYRSFRFLFVGRYHGPVAKKIVKKVIGNA